MKKSSLFISALLTAFFLAVMAGVFTAYRSFSGTSQASVQQPAPVVASIPTGITAQQAAQVAANYLGRNDLYAVENSSFNGSSAFMVSFSSGDIVYVSPQGQVLSVSAAPSTTAGSGLHSFFSSGFSGEQGERDGGD